MRSGSAAWRLRLPADGICDVTCSGLLTLPAVRWSSERADEFGHRPTGCVIDLRGAVLGFDDVDIRGEDWHAMSRIGADSIIALPWALLCTPDQVNTLMFLAMESALHGFWRRVFTQPDQARQWVMATAAQLAARQRT